MRIRPLWSWKVCLECSSTMPTESPYSPLDAIKNWQDSPVKQHCKCPGGLCIHSACSHLPQHGCLCLAAYHMLAVMCIVSTTISKFTAMDTRGDMHRRRCHSHSWPFLPCPCPIPALPHGHQRAQASTRCAPHYIGHPLWHRHCTSMFFFLKGFQY